MGWRRFWQRKRRDEDLARELESYLAHEEDEKANAGWSPGEARSAARRKLGNVMAIREEVYKMNTLALIDVLWRDVRYSLRQLRLNPGFTLTAMHRWHWESVRTRQSSHCSTNSFSAGCR